MEATQFRVSEKIGPNMAWTDEGFLICRNVPISRTGVLLYGATEIPDVAPGPDGLIRIERHNEDVFDAESIKSAHGKPLLSGHPVFDVNPENFKSLTVGTVVNPRRGENIFDDCVVADILVMDKAAIEDVLTDKREVSAGYDCKYFDLGGGRGRQTNIVYNHVALVESGRCGPRCSIKDHAMEKENTMAKTSTRRPWLDKLRSLGSALTGDRKATFDEAIEEAEKETKDNEGELTEPGKRDRTTTDDDLAKRLEEHEKRLDEHDAKHATHDKKHMSHDKRLRTHDERLDQIEGKIGGEHKGDMGGEEETKTGDAVEKEDREIEGELKEEAPPGTGDRASKSKDSAFLAPTWGSTKSIAEILVPGIRIPTFDAKGDPRVTYKGICNFRRQVLSMGLLSADTNQVIAEVRGGRTLDSNTLDKMPCSEVRQVFYAAGAAKKAANTRDMQAAGRFTNSQGSGGGVGVTSRVKTPAEINQENRKRYAGN